MKKILSFVLSDWIKKEYESITDLRQSIADLGLDGLEVIRADQMDLSDKSLIQGVHLPFFTSWLDHYLGNTENLKQEFANLDQAQDFYQYKSEDFHHYFQADLEYAEQNAHYTVFHLANISSAEYLTNKSYYSSEEVIDYTVELINKLLKDRPRDNLFLIENLYYAGMNLLDPALTRRALEGIDYANKGIMLDTGHLMCTNPNIHTEDQGWDYVLEILNKHRDLLPYFKGIHLHVSTGGSHYQAVKQNPPPKIEDFYQRFEEIYRQVEQIDRHQIAQSDKVNQVIDLVEPEYLVLEFRAKDRQEREDLAKKQLAVIKR